MAIQKLLPSSQHSGIYGSYYGQSGQVGVLIQNTNRYLSPDVENAIINYSGGETYGIESTYYGDSLNYIRKTLSAPDDSTYVGLGVSDGVSGTFIPGRTKVSFRISMPLDIPSLAIDSITPRFRYSGIPLIDGDTYYKEDIISRFWIYDKNDNDGFPYSPLLLYNNPTFSYSGDSRSSFVDISMPTTSLTSFISQSDLDNRFYSGDYLLFTLDFPVSGYILPTSEVSNITLDKNIAFSAFEFEASGRLLSKSVDMFLCSNIPIEVTNNVNMYNHCPPIGVSGGVNFYTKRHGYINSIEEVTRSGNFNLYPTNGTYANSGSVFEIFPVGYTDERVATGYDGGTTELMVPPYGGDNPMTRYLRQSSDDVVSMSNINIKANHTASVGTVVYYGGSSDYTNLLDSNDATFVSSTGSYSSVTFPLEDMPSDFLTAEDILVSLRVSAASISKGAETIVVAEILKADGTTPLTNTTTFTVTSSVINIEAKLNILLSDKSSWTGALLKIRNQPVTTDGVTIYKVSTTLTYNNTSSSTRQSYVGLTNHVSHQSGRSTSLNIAIGTQLTSITKSPISLTTTLKYSGDLNTLDYNIQNLVSQYYLNLNDISYYIGKSDYGTVAQVNNTAFSFQKIYYPTLYFDGRAQTHAGNRVYVSGALLANLISSGATLSTYTTLGIIETTSASYGYRNHGISAFNVYTEGAEYTEYLPHPSLYMEGTLPNSGNLDLSIPNVTIPVNSGLPLYLNAKSGTTNDFNLYTSGNNQINSGLNFVMPSPSFAIKDLPFYTPGNYLTSLNMYIENGTFKNSNNNFTLTTYNNYTSGELTKNINFHTSSQSGVEDNINMFIGGDGSFSGNTNLPMFINSFNQSGVDNVSLFINNLLTSGNYGLDLYIANTITESGNINLYINGGGYGAENNNISLYVENTPYNLESGISLFLPNNFGSISSPSGNSKPGNIDFHTYSVANSSGNMNLSIPGGRYGLSSGNINVYVNSDMPSGNIDLSIHNTLDYLTKDINFNLTSILDLSGDITFSIDGGGIDLRQGELNLFTRSAITDSGSLDFSILGNISREPINLSIRVNELLEIGSGVPLSIFSAFNSGVFDSFTITTKARGYESSLPMYLPTSSTGSDNANIYMVMLNDTRSNKDVFLYIENNTQTNSANYTLFTQGEGTLKNGYVYNSSMNLFINRGNESVYNTIPMTLAGPSGMFESVPLVLSGGYINDSGITLTMPSTSALITNRADMYSHGFLY